MVNSNTNLGPFFIFCDGDPSGKQWLTFNNSKITLTSYPQDANRWLLIPDDDNAGAYYIQSNNGSGTVVQIASDGNGKVTAVDADSGNASTWKFVDYAPLKTGVSIQTIQLTNSPGATKPYLRGKTSDGTVSAEKNTSENRGVQWIIFTAEDIS